MNTLFVTLRQTLGSPRLLWLLYGITLVLGLLAALPFYNTLKVEDQNSLAFLNLLNGFDYTIYSDFMHRSERAINPLFSVGRWLGGLYIFLSVFVAGGILLRFSQTRPRFDIGMFWQACSQYVGRFLRLFGVSFLFVLAGGGLWLVLGTLIHIALEDKFTERGLFWVGASFFALFALTVTFILCIGDYAKVLMFREDERGALRAFGRAGRLVLRNPGKTYGLYLVMILTGTGLFGMYFLIDEAITMNGWLTILLMLVVQQSLVFARVGLKVWSLGTAYAIYGILPKPVPVVRPMVKQEAVVEPTPIAVSEEEKSQPPVD
ncbi:hypothetical protein G8759_33435 [Spirosoma aureum]|uniref:Beta-carotene 15,15'-monooxygenase n=1 Tax=Spirosoma aureum TaxID=2692134 RepID=A0A6G9AXV8_9BACT|nr:hypothetical protein [Spirosoma aureum]QIP17196.1 hypothetical protein G8759_33435 [Spirosoma aureum]